MDTTKLDDPRPPQVTADDTTMWAIVQDRYGSEPEDVLRLARVDRPTIADDEVLLRVRAAGLDRGTWHIMAGLPYPMRLMGFGLRAPKDRVRGREVAGRVESVGNAASQLNIGDEVFGIAEGSFADYARARADKLAHKPSNLSFEHAAAVTISALTALQAVRDRGRVRPGQQVLIIGASGGVGTFAVQIAKSSGAEVTGVCSTDKVDMVRSLGAEHVIDYTVDDITGGQCYDVIIDAGGHRSLQDAAASPHQARDARHRRIGNRWTLARRFRPVDPRHAVVAVRQPAARSAHELRERGRSGGVGRACRIRARWHRSSTGPTRSARPSPRSVTCSTGTPAARSSSRPYRRARSDDSRVGWSAAGRVGDRGRPGRSGPRLSPRIHRAALRDRGRRRPGRARVALALGFAAAVHARAVRQPAGPAVPGGAGHLPGQG